ncbi:beta-ketoacyl synthase chain length factor [Streptomyces sp. NPDC020983]|uniref:beta-ketoacyl synthase chain length factor n=1 Tax=Streptomyces sp. NPDC020983 TaxID=3365106 RepID=UPI0037A675B9
MTFTDRTAARPPHSPVRTAAGDAQPRTAPTAPGAQAGPAPSPGHRHAGSDAHPAPPPGGGDRVTAPPPEEGPGHGHGGELALRAREYGLRVLAGAGWPEGAGDREPPVLPGFVGSSFSPLAAEVARRCLGRRPGGPVACTGLVVVSTLGDLQGAVRLAEAVDTGGAPGPLAFFQAVPNAVAGHVAARWGLSGPVVSVADGTAGMEVAALLVEDGDADEVLLIRVDQAATAGARDRAAAVLLSGGDVL